MAKMTKSGREQLERLLRAELKAAGMPIKPELRWYYPIDWPQISHWVRFVRAKGRCQVCGRPHGEAVQHLGDGRWWDEQLQTWRDGSGLQSPLACPNPGCAGENDQGGAGGSPSRS